MLIDLLNWLDMHAGAVQGVSTFVLVVVTIWYATTARKQAKQAENQVEETRQQRFDQHRPVVHSMGSLALAENHPIVWGDAKGYDLQLQNVGTGVALIVCGVMFPPEPASRTGGLSPRYDFWRESAFSLGQPARSVKLELGKTRVEGDVTIDGHRLFAPKTPTQEERLLGGQYNVIARLTLTYRDISMRKHAAVFDYIDLYGWQCVALPADIPRDLLDIDQAVHAKVHDAVKHARNVVAAGPNKILRG